MGMVIPYNDPHNFASGRDVSVSPFTLVFQAAKLDSAAHVVNAVILTTVSLADPYTFDEANLCILVAVLWK
jgi:amino acid permease